MPFEKNVRLTPPTNFHRHIQVQPSPSSSLLTNIFKDMDQVTALLFLTLRNVSADFIDNMHRLLNNAAVCAIQLVASVPGVHLPSFHC